jgi:tRNA dimethylallyltransferase
MSNCLILGLAHDPEDLKRSIKQRVDTMVEQGFVDEVKRLQKDYPKDLEAFKAPGYQPFIQYVNGQLSLDDAKAQFVQNDLKLAKKQRTWFKRNKSIHWLTDKISGSSDPSNVVDLVTTFLNT